MSAEGRGLRAIKGKGLIVRYGNPFANGTTEVMFESNEPLVGVAIASSGALHAIGKRHHTNASGAWKSSPSELDRRRARIERRGADHRRTRGTRSDAGSAAFRRPMTKRARFEPEALEELDAAVQRVDAARPGWGEKLVDEVFVALDHIERNASAWQTVDGIGVERRFVLDRSRASSCTTKLPPTSSSQGVRLGVRFATLVQTGRKPKRKAPAAQLRLKLRLKLRAGAAGGSCGRELPASSRRRV